MAGFKNHDVGGPGEVSRSWGIGTILGILTEEREMRQRALDRGDVGAAKDHHWIVISCLIALGVCTVAVAS